MRPDNKKPGDLYVFSVKGDSRDQLRSVRLPPSETKGWLAPRSVLAATKGSGGFRLLYLCGFDHFGRRCSDYPNEVVEIFESYNPGNLTWAPPGDVAGRLLRLGAINEVELDDTGKITRFLPPDSASAFEDSRDLPQIVVTVTDHGETCDGHARLLGTVHTNSDATALIEEDKARFREMMDDLHENHYNEKTNEIWWDDTNGRTYDVIVL